MRGAGLVGTDTAGKGTSRSHGLNMQLLTGDRPSSHTAPDVRPDRWDPEAAACGDTVANSMLLMAWGEKVSPMQRKAHPAFFLT